MNSTIQIVAFYVMSAVLLGFAVYYTSQKHFRLSGLFVLLSFVSFVLAQFSGEGLPVGFHSISIEQCLCWGFGFLFLLAAVYFVHKQALAYGFVVVIFAVCSCFCGLSSVQSLLKTHMLWMVTDSLKSYGDKIDTYQTTVAEIQERLSNKQSELESNQLALIKQITDQKRELDAVQSKIREAETNIIGQQSDITNQYQKISLMQSDLKITETNLDAQENKISDVTYWVQNLFDRQRQETFSIADTNSLRLIVRTNSFYCIVRLKEIPLNNSVEFLVMDNNSKFPQPGKSVISQRNIVVSQGLVQFDRDTLNVTVKYVADARDTNVDDVIPSYFISSMDLALPK